MKQAILKIMALSATLTLLIAVSAMAQRIITGTVYKEGRPVIGVTVEAHRSGDSFITNMDGRYRIKVDPACKYLRFTLVEDSRRLDIEGKIGNVFDFSFDGKLPEKVEYHAGIDMRSYDELTKSGEKIFASTFAQEDQYFKQRDYKSALAPWRVLFYKYPKATVNIYLHGCALYEAMFKNSTDWNEKNSYIDSVMLVYERRIKNFEDKGFVRGRQGTDFLDMKRQNENWSDFDLRMIMKRGYAYLDESVKLQGDKSEAPVLVLYMQTASRMFRTSDMSRDRLIGIYSNVSGILDRNLAANPTDEKYKQAKEAVIQIFENSGAADCVTLNKLYTAKYEEISKDVNTLKKMLRTLDKADCTESELFIKATEKLYQLSPSAEAAYNMARIYLKKKDFTKGKEYFKQALLAEKDPELLSKYYYELASFLFTSEQNFEESVSYLKKSLTNNGNNGQALILLGDIYAAYSPQYGKKDTEHRSLFWLAVDYYNKAKRIDPDLASEANTKIASYSQQFPEKENLFLERIQVGDQYKIGSWINEITTVRERQN